MRIKISASSTREIISSLIPRDVHRATTLNYPSVSRQVSLGQNCKITIKANFPKVNQNNQINQIYFFTNSQPRCTLCKICDLYKIYRLLSLAVEKIMTTTYKVPYMWVPKSGYLSLRPAQKPMHAAASLNACKKIQPTCGPSRTEQTEYEQIRTGLQH